MGRVLSSEVGGGTGPWFLYVCICIRVLISLWKVGGVHLHVYMLI